MDTTTAIRSGALEDRRHDGRPEEGGPVIWIRDLAKVYRGGIAALDGIDFSVRRRVID